MVSGFDWLLEDERLAREGDGELVSRADGAGELTEGMFEFVSQL
jgi:hypothetical protein